MTDRRHFLHTALAGTLALTASTRAAGAQTVPAAAQATPQVAASAGPPRDLWQQDHIGGQARNVELLAFHDLGGPGRAGYQMAMVEEQGRHYLYVLHWATAGITILDVTDPRAPELLNHVPEPSGKQGISMVKLQVADGIGISHMQTRKFDLFFGPQPAGTEYDEGVLIWDFKNPVHPKVISRWNTGTPKGTHRNFYNGGRYVHMTAGAPGYQGFIYRILDIADPAKPRVVGQWAHPEQPTDPEDKRHIELHMAYVEGDRAYLAYWGIGMVILDISDVTNPRHISTLRTHPPFGGGAGGASVHTVVPYAARKLAVISTEGERPFALNPDSDEGFAGLKGKQQPLNMVGVAAIDNEREPVLISTFPKPVPPPGSIWGEDYSTLNGVHYPFGNHNLHQPQGLSVLDQRDDRVHCAYFTAGLRVFDISAPYTPREIAAYCPPDPKTFNWERNGGFPGPLTMCAEDILVDSRGVIYLTNSQDGLHILRTTV
jgi:hypothetical protein